MVVIIMKLNSSQDGWHTFTQADHHLCMRVLSVSTREGWLSLRSKECWSHASDSWRSAMTSKEMIKFHGHHVNVNKLRLKTSWGIETYEVYGSGHAFGSWLRQCISAVQWFPTVHRLHIRSNSEFSFYYYCAFLCLHFVFVSKYRLSQQAGYW